MIIPSHNPKSFVTWASFFLVLISAEYLSISSSSSLSSATDQISSHTHNQEQSFNYTQEAMKVHPLPKKRNSIAIQYYVNNSNGINNQRGLPSGGSSHKKLRRLPHIFTRVLELPFRSDADVSVEEGPDCFRFVAGTENIGEVRAQAIEICPGVTKVVIRPNGYLELLSLDDLELDIWRFRLPESTVPELATAVLMDGELIVTVPKREEADEEKENDGEFRGGGMGNNNNNARLVLVR